MRGPKGWSGKLALSTLKRLRRETLTYAEMYD
jgi:hypothetical protein